jgi:hypothetical protein
MNMLKKYYSYILIFLSTFLVLSTAVPSRAVEAFYFYDDLNRISRVVSDKEYAIYSYDEVGNLLSITSETLNTAPPEITGITPDVTFAGTVIPFTITGANLISTTGIQVDIAGVDISNVMVTDTKITGTLNIDPDIVPGNVSITVDTRYGSTNISIAILKLTINPSIKILGVGEAVEFSLTLSEPAPKNMNIALTSGNPSVVTVPASVVIVGGQNSTTFSAKSLVEGTTVIRADGAGSSTSVYVTQPFTAPATPITPAISVLVEKPSLDIVVDEGPFLNRSFSVLLKEPIDTALISKGPFIARPISVFLPSQQEATVIDKGPFLNSPISVLISAPSEIMDINKGPFLDKPVSVLLEAKEAVVINNGPYISLPISVKLP